MKEVRAGRADVLAVPDRAAGEIPGSCSCRRLLPGQPYPVDRHELDFS